MNHDKRLRDSVHCAGNLVGRLPVICGRFDSQQKWHFLPHRTGPNLQGARDLGHLRRLQRTKARGQLLAGSRLVNVRRPQSPDKSHRQKTSQNEKSKPPVHFGSKARGNNSEMCPTKSTFIFLRTSSGTSSQSCRLSMGRITCRIPDLAVHAAPHRHRV